MVIWQGLMVRKLSVLIVDDEIQIQRQLKVGLGAERFRTSEARTAEAALNLLAAEEFDAVILDLGLPDQSGLAVLETIRKTSTVPVLVLSMRNDEAGRMQLALTIDEARIEAETERLRSAMLTSLSHDLRTPLTTIIGTHSTIESAVERARPLTASHSVSVALPPDLPMVEADFLLLEQVMFNVLDNASKYAPAGTVIEMAAKLEDGMVVLEVADQGPAFLSMRMRPSSINSHGSFARTGKRLAPGWGSRSFADSCKQWAV